MRPRFFFALAATLAGTAIAGVLAASAGDGGAPKYRLSGGFIQFQAAMKRKPQEGGMTEEKWQNVLGDMADAQLRVAIIQYTQHGAEDFIPQGQEFIDTTGVILRLAEKSGLEVHVGLKYAPRWYKCWS